MIVNAMILDTEIMMILEDDPGSLNSSAVVTGGSVPRKALGFSVETGEGAALIDGRIVGVIDGAGDVVGDGVDTTILFGIFTSVTFIPKTCI